MAETLEVGVCYLVSEFLTDTLILFRLFKTAGAVSASFLKSLLYGLDYFFILVKCDSRFHFNTPLFLGVSIITHFLQKVCNKVTKHIIFSRYVIKYKNDLKYSLRFDRIVLVYQQ